MTRRLLAVGVLLASAACGSSGPAEPPDSPRPDTLTVTLAHLENDPVYTVTAWSSGDSVGFARGRCYVFKLVLNGPVHVRDVRDVWCSDLNMGALSAWPDSVTVSEDGWRCAWGAVPALSDSVEVNLCPCQLPERYCDGGRP